MKIMILDIFFKINIEYDQELHDLHIDLPFLAEKIEINGHNKLLCMQYDKKNYVVDIRNMKQALEHGLKPKKAHNAIAFYQEAWLKPYIKMNTELRKNAKNDFEKDSYKLINNSVFGKTMENVRTHRDIKLAINNKKRCKLPSKPNYYTTKWFSKSFLAIEIKKTKVKMNKTIYLGFSILQVSKTLMCEFWYGYIKSSSYNRVIHRQIVLSFILKEKIFMKILHLMLIIGLILLVI